MKLTTLIVVLLFIGFAHAQCDEDDLAGYEGEWDCLCDETECWWESADDFEEEYVDGDDYWYGTQDAVSVRRSMMDADDCFDDWDYEDGSGFCECYEDGDEDVCEWWEYCDDDDEDPECERRLR